MAELEPIQSVASRAMKMIADYAFPAGATARCPKCQAARHAETSEIAIWMSEGFPECKKCKGKITIDNPHLRK